MLPHLRPSRAPHSKDARFGIRWTIGAVAPRGFEALRLSICGAQRLFGREAAYAVVVNTIPLSRAKTQVGAFAEPISWLSAPACLPAWLGNNVDASMADSVLWKLCPLTVHHGLPELALDNDVVLWSRPTAIDRWLDEGGVILAEHVRRGFGQFDGFCGPRPLNTGIRGTSRNIDLGEELARMLTVHPVSLKSELDEQGLQVAALRRIEPLHVVSTDEVSICSPFRPHQPEPGRAGAHFVGLNTHAFGWDYHGRPAEEVRAEHWDQVRDRVAALVGDSAQFSHASTRSETPSADAASQASEHEQNLDPIMAQQPREQTKQCAGRRP